MSHLWCFVWILYCLFYRNVAPPVLWKSPFGAFQSGLKLQIYLKTNIQIQLLRSCFLSFLFSTYFIRGYYKFNCFAVRLQKCEALLCKSPVENLQ